MHHLLRRAVHLLAPLTANCSDFNKHWEAAGEGDGSMAGRWTGEWVSAASGHRGALQCVLEAAREDLWHARFRAGYAGIFRACYGSDFHVARLGPDRWTFSGRTDLGPLAGGTYEYSGEASTGTFTCRYTCKDDHGEFRLKRA